MNVDNILEHIETFLLDLLIIVLEILEFQTFYYQRILEKNIRKKHWMGVMLADNNLKRVVELERGGA